MDNKKNTGSEPWYWFIHEVMKCDQASAIRCFLAPVYLPYINETDDIENVRILKGYLDFYEDKVTDYTFDDNTSLSSPEIIKYRIKSLGLSLCEEVKKEKDIDCKEYLGKNRNIANFPERFIGSIFPSRESEGIFEELWSYYYQLLCQVFRNNTSYAEEVLQKLEEINNNYECFHVRAIHSELNDVYLKNIERMAYLLSSFCVLSSALAVENNAKNGVALHIREKVLEKAQIFLEIPINSKMNTNCDEVGMSYDDLFRLNSNILLSGNKELLQLIYDIDEKNLKILNLPGKDCMAIKTLITSIKNAERRIVDLMNNQYYDIEKGAKELLILTRIETLWKGVYNNQ